MAQPAAGVTVNVVVKQQTFPGWYHEQKQNWREYAKKYPDEIKSRAFSIYSSFVDTAAAPLTRLGTPPLSWTDKIKGRLPHAPDAFGFASFVYNWSWGINAASARAIQALSTLKEPGDAPLARDAAICLMALHTLKAGWNTWDLLTRRSFESFVGLACDAAALVALDKIVVDNKNQDFEVKKE